MQDGRGDAEGVGAGGEAVADRGDLAVERASVSTTVIAFMPLLFVSGVMGKFMAVMPVAIIGMLLVSLVECVTILPCHLAHEDSLVFRLLGGLTKPFRWTPITLSAILLGTAGLWWLLGGPAGEQLAARLNEAAPVPPQQLRQRVLFTGGALLLLGGLSYIPVIFGWINRAAESALDAFIGRVYLPTLKLAIKHQMEFIACCIAVLNTDASTLETKHGISSGICSLSPATSASANDDRSSGEQP